MKETIKVTKENIDNLKTKDWTFHITEIRNNLSKKAVKEGLDINCAIIYAKRKTTTKIVGVFKTRIGRDTDKISEVGFDSFLKLDEFIYKQFVANHNGEVNSEFQYAYTKEWVEDGYGKTNYISEKEVSDLAEAEEVELQFKKKEETGVI